MDEVTQQNAALVEEAAASAASLEDQAQNLVKAISIYKLSTAHTEAKTEAKTATPVTNAKPARRPVVSAPAPKRKARVESNGHMALAAVGAGSSNGHGTPKPSASKNGAHDGEWESF
jgi:hypothetical protein